MTGAVFQKHPAKEFAADGIGERLRTWDFLTAIQIQTVPIVTGAAQLVDERDSPLPLSAGRAWEGAVRLPLNERQRRKME